MSQQTAEELVKLGKESWIVPRKDKITAKGKGQLDTFWLLLSSPPLSSVSSNLDEKTKLDLTNSEVQEKLTKAADFSRSYSISALEIRSSNGTARHK